ncbi:DUF4221 family protein [Algoriphagus litoralis]|uniref:DUF4221 family protein n=1 Tax=Algoriphagus litoralis TaxID=2202829 RepID=UPI000DB99DB9|nr:DUF4221 family protein [Algoriphagus litoralis]
MSRLALSLSLFLLFSCGGNSSEKSESGNILENLTFDLDTVVMDPGDELVNLQFSPSQFDLSPDQRRYYFMHRNSGEMTVFDLEERRLIKKILFEKEGPNAIPNFVYSFQLFDENKFLLTDSRNISFYDSSGVKLRSVPFDKDNFPELTEDEGYSLITGLKVDDQQQIFYSLPNDPKSERVSLAIWDSATGQSRLVSLPEFGFLTKFTLVFRDGNSYSGASFANLKLKLEQDRAIIYSSGTSSIYSFDLTMDSLYFKRYEPKMFPFQAEAPLVSEFSSKQEFDEGIGKARAQISFGDLFWDESRTIYFRFASISKPNLNPELPAKSEVYLMAFDKELNLIGETRLEELSFPPTWAFFKDGKLWTYVNVEDELGFAVMDFKF